MKDLINFFHQVGKLKDMPRRGWVINNIKNPESIADHVFRASLMAWILGSKKKLNIERILKTALIHDICEVYAGDATPYDSILPKNAKAQKELMKTWPRLSEKDKKKLREKKYKKEKGSLEKITKDLPKESSDEIRHLWFDYEKGLSPEGRFFKHADRIESFLQAAEYWRDHKKISLKPYWVQARELHDDPTLNEFIEQIDKEFHNGKELKE